MCNKKGLKTKIKSYDGKVNTNFRGDKLLNKGSHCICLTIMSINSVFRLGKNYYPQVFLEESKCIVKEKKKMGKYITDTIEISSNDSDEENVQI